MVPIKYHYARKPRPLLTSNELATLAIGFAAGAFVVTAIHKPRHIGCLMSCCNAVLDAIIKQGK
jgi:hypothetical protein